MDILLNEPNHRIASYFAIMRLRLSALTNAKEDSIRARAKEIFAEIKSSSRSSARECLEKYWDETNKLRADYLAYCDSRK